MTIKNIIFDIGNVLMAFCWEKHFRSFGFSEDIFQKVAKATVLSPTWDEFDKGALNPEQLLRDFIKNDPTVEEEIRQVYEDISGTIEIYPYAEEWIRTLKENGYNVYVLSNFSEKLHNECGNKVDFLKEVDGYILSYQEKLIKPDDRIYQTLIQRYGLVPEESVFIDDRADNIQAARKNGLLGIVFQSYEETIELLQSMKVKISI
ncbi:HAD family hydrolase [Anaerosporobacter sp.]|uniref:HAD family hydrolase n=1 Tax=Anaerosporobacter sp. TaxID=1872529 RepID=UPI00286EDF7D|nr:HAD family phosphatase [Anaerosporobacter sp.]